MGEGDWPNHHVTFIAAEKVYFTFPLALFTVHQEGSRRLAENVMWEEGVG